MTQTDDLDQRVERTETTDLVQRAETPVVASEAGAMDVGALLQQAIGSGIEPDALAKLVDLAGQMEDRQARRAFNGALARFSGLVPVIRHNKTVTITSKKPNVPPYTYTYATLSHIDEQIGPALRACGLHYSFDREMVDGRDMVACWIRHVDGHKEVTHFPIVADNRDMKAIGGADSFAKRYALRNALGLAPTDETVDGEEDHSGISSGSKPITAHQEDELLALLEEVNADLERFLLYFDIETVADLPVNRYEEAVQLAESKRR